MNTCPRLTRPAATRLWIVFTVATLGACTSVTEEPPLPVSITTADDDNSRAIGAELRRVFAPIAEDHDLAGVIRIERADRVVAEAVFGYADIDAERPNQSDTLFDIGSITKSFTATLLLLLEEDGLIDRDAKLSEYFPSHAFADLITVRQVMEHRAGLPRDIPDKDEAVATREGLLVWLDGQELLFEPGTDEAYSNIGYQLLAELIETVSGQDYAQALRTKVFEPAGIPGAGLAGASIMPDANIATPYQPGPGSLDLSQPVISYARHGDSGVLLSAEQLIDWVAAVESATLAELIPDGEAPIGNVHVREYDGVSVIQQQGSTPGGGAGVVLSPGDGLTVAYTFNVSSYPLWGLEPTLFKIGRGETLEETPESRPLPIPLEASHRELAGRYTHPQFGPVTITNDANRMTLTVEALGFDFYLTPVADGALHWRVFNTVLKRSDHGADLTAEMQLIGSPKQSFGLAPIPNDAAAAD